jgi:hypothetical protein
MTAYQAMTAAKTTRTDADALRLVVEGTAAETGTAFFRALVRNLAAVMDTLGAWVTEYLPEQKRLRAYAFWLNGAFVEHFEYAIAGTACAPVVEDKRLVHIPDRLLELYPGDPDIRAVNAVSYLGRAVARYPGRCDGASVRARRQTHARGSAAHFPV